MEQFIKYGGQGVHTDTRAVAIASSDGVGMSGRTKILAGAMGFAISTTSVRQRNIDQPREDRYSDPNMNQWHDLFGPDHIAA